MSSPTSTSKRERESEMPPASQHKKQALERPNPSISSILDLPNEILINIILRLNARERVALGSLCNRFKTLIYGDEQLLRYLDFSKDGHLTSMSDIQPYFNNDTSCKRVLGVNLKNTSCMKPGRMLNDSIGKAMNIVDINMNGIQFEDIWQLGAFLNPLLHLQKLSFDWPETEGDSIPMCCKILHHPFSRLKSLAVRMKTLEYVKVLIPSLQACQELRKLRLVAKNCDVMNMTHSDSWDGEPKTLKSLKVVEYCGPEAMELRKRIVPLLPNPEKWADFKLQNSSVVEGFYLALVDVSEELAGMKGTASIPSDSDLVWALVPEVLLKEVLKINHEDVPKEFCCLPTVLGEQRCLLKIGEIERLLKDPGCEISYLYTNHPVHLGCDIHLVASAFQNLTELVLPAITRYQKSLPMDSHFERRLRKKGSIVYDEVRNSLNMDSSFKMLVENTPNLRHFTLGGSSSHKNWDLEELHLIAKWKNLETLRLLKIPITDGAFLIEIGKQCQNLETVEFMDLGSETHGYSYESELRLMLSNCRNLRDFSVEAKKLGDLSAVFSSLASNIQLRKIRIKAVDNTYDSACFAATIEQSLRVFTQLTTFVSDIDCQASNYNTLLSDLARLEVNRQNLQIQVAYKPHHRGLPTMGFSFASAPQHKKMKTLHEDTPDEYPFPHIWTAN